MCFKLDASTQVDIFTKVIKNTKKLVTYNMLHFITIMVILFIIIIILSNKSFSIIANRLSDHRHLNFINQSLNKPNTKKLQLLYI